MANIIKGGLVILGLLFIIVGLSIAIEDSPTYASSLSALYSGMVYILYFVVAIYMLYILISGFDYLKKLRFGNSP